MTYSLCMSSGRTALALLAASLVVGLAAGPAATTAAASNASATSAYVAANYSLVRTARSYLRRAEAAPLAVLAKVTRECPLVGEASPQDPQSTELSNEVIGAMVVAAYHLNVPGLRSFIGRVKGLRWSNSHLTRAVRAYAAQVQVLANLSPPDLCGDIRAWKLSGFQTLPATTLSFDAKFMPAWVALGEVPSSLRPYETPAEKSVLAHSNTIEEELTEGEARAVESWGKIMNELEIQP
jgi:hypothetical protein